MGGHSKISLKGAQFPKDATLFAVFFYVRHTMSYHDQEEIMVERRVIVDHATLNRWVVQFEPLTAEVKRLLKFTENEASLARLRRPPTDGVVGEGLDQESDANKSLPSREICEAADQQYMSGSS
jgi:hypothetical protein